MTARLLIVMLLLGAGALTAQAKIYQVVRSNGQLYLVDPAKRSVWYRVTHPWQLFQRPTPLTFRPEGFGGSLSAAELRGTTPPASVPQAARNAAQGAANYTSRATRSLWQLLGLRRSPTPSGSR